MTEIYLGLLLAAVGGVLFCVSALESALSALREHRIPTIASGDSVLAGQLRDFLASKDARLGQVLILSASCNTAMAAFGLLLIRHLAPDSRLSPIALGAIVFGVLIAACHLLPNLLANLRPRWVFKVLGPPVLTLASVVKPFERALQTTARWMANLIVPSSVQPNQSLRDEELGTLVEMRRDEGTLEDLEGEVIYEILKLGDKTAKDCMTPRVDAVTISLRLPPDEAARRIREQAHRFVPVYDRAPDEIVGVLDVMAYLLSGDDADMASHTQAPIFVPETLGALTLFHRHLGGGALVVVLDEFGGFEGIVTKTDIIEHLVADAAPTEDIEIQDLGGGRFLVSGSARLDELREITGIDLETEGLDTIGGLIATTLGRTPSPGERVQVEPFTATIRKSTSKRVEELLLWLPHGNIGGGGEAR